MASVYFIESNYPAKPEKNGIDATVAFKTVKAALEHAKKKASTDRPEAIIRNLRDDSVGVFINAGKDELALIMEYRTKEIPLIS
jgi:hypothetical protein